MRTRHTAFGCIPAVPAALLTIGAAVLATTLPAWGQEAPRRVVTAPVEMRRLPQTMTLVGTVQPVTRSTLGTEIAGIVVEMPVRQGDAVDQGRMICRLNDDTLRLQFEREKARLSALKQRLEELEAGTRQEVIDRLRGSYQAAKAEADLWEFELNRVTRLLGEDHANEKEWQDTQAEHLAALGRLAAAKAELDEAIAGPRKEVIAAARYEVAEQRTVTERLETDLAKTRIRAPFAGLVARRFTEVGSWLSVGGSVVELIDLSTVLVTVDVPESAIVYANTGQSVRVFIDALKRTFEGRIRHVIPQADESARTFPVEVAIDNPDLLLKGGMFARATVMSGDPRETVAVLKDALIDIDGQMHVAVITADKDGHMAMPTPVTLGADSDKWIAVTSGNLNTGAKVAIYGNEHLVFPQPVTVVDSSEKVKGASSARGHSRERNAESRTPQDS